MTLDNYMTPDEFEYFKKVDAALEEVEIKKREKAKERNRKWREANPERMPAYRLKWNEANPEKRKESQTNWYTENVERERARSRRRYAANPGRYKELRRKRNLKNYDMTIEAFDALLSTQEGRCACCRTDTPGRGWQVDHCHKINKVRGILCHNCNLGLGHAKDSVEVLETWISYLQR